MRILLLASLVLAVACGDDNKVTTPDARVDAPVSIDAALDAPIDAPAADGIAAARAAADGTGLTLEITNVTVTYVKPALGTLTNDPAGFTIQAAPTGPALFVSVDPATLTPVLAAGDVVSFTITTMGTVGMQRRAQAIENLTRSATGTSLAPFAQNVSAATDLVSNQDAYDSELVTVTGTLFQDPIASGSGFLRSGITTAGIAADTNLQLRAPTTLVDAQDIANGCVVTATNVPVSRFNAQTQINVYSTADFTMTCPAPTVASAIALSATSVRITFSRNVLASSVMADGSQFTFDNGLTASAATVSGRTVTVTTSAQTIGTTYTATVATSVTDLQGTALTAPLTAMFAGFITPAVVRINELNANITGGCDLIELRVISGGSMTGFKLQERTGGSGEMVFTFPAFTVATNDLIVVHVNSASATCNPGTATDETTSIIDQPALTYARNYDTAYDFYSADPGLVATNNVFTLFDTLGTIVDAVFVTDVSTLTAAGATLTAANAVGAATQWTAGPTYDSPQFLAVAVDDLNMTGTTPAGASIQRIDDTDDNDKADWTTGAGAIATFGLINVGQLAQ